MNTLGAMFYYHPIIPFKNYRTIIQQLVWAKDNNYGKNNYNLRNRNCQHFANSAVLGIDFSQQIHENKNELIALNATKSSWSGASYGVGLAGIIAAPFTMGASLWLAVPALAAGSFGTIRMDRGEYSTINNDKDSVNLRNEINNDPLSTKQDWETKQLEELYEAKVEQSVKINDCIIM